MGPAQELEQRVDGLIVFQPTGAQHGFAMPCASGTIEERPHRSTRAFVEGSLHSSRGMRDGCDRLARVIASLCEPLAEARDRLRGSTVADRSEQGSAPRLRTLTEQCADAWQLARVTREDATRRLAQQFRASRRLCLGGRLVHARGEQDGELHIRKRAFTADALQTRLELGGFGLAHGERSELDAQVGRGGTSDLGHQREYGESERRQHASRPFPRACAACAPLWHSSSRSRARGP